MYRKLQFKLMKHILVLNFHSTRNNLNKYSDTVLLPKTKFPQKLVGKKLTEQNKHVFEVRLRIVAATITSILFK